MNRGNFIEQLERRVEVSGRKLDDLPSGGFWGSGLPVGSGPAGSAPQLTYNDRQKH
jgi:hypothetical protein